MGTFLKTLLMWDDPTEAQAIVMRDILLTIQYNPKNNKELINDPNNYIVTKMHSSLAPVMRMLESDEVLRHAGSDEGRDLWRCILANSIFWKVRREINHGKVDRSNELQKIINEDYNIVTGATLKKFKEDISIYAKLYHISRKYNKENKINKDLFLNNPKDTK